MTAALEEQFRLIFEQSLATQSLWQTLDQQQEACRPQLQNLTLKVDSLCSQEAAFRKQTQETLPDLRCRVISLHSEFVSMANKLGSVNQKQQVQQDQLNNLTVVIIEAPAPKKDDSRQWAVVVGVAHVFAGLVLTPFTPMLIPAAVCGGGLKATSYALGAKQRFHPSLFFKELAYGGLQSLMFTGFTSLVGPISSVVTRILFNGGLSAGHDAFQKALSREKIDLKSLLISVGAGASGAILSELVEKVVTVSGGYFEAFLSGGCVGAANAAGHRFALNVFEGNDLMQNMPEEVSWAFLLSGLQRVALEAKIKRIQETKSSLEKEGKALEAEQSNFMTPENMINRDIEALRALGYLPEYSGENITFSLMAGGEVTFRKGKHWVKYRWENGRSMKSDNPYVLSSVYSSTDKIEKHKKEQLKKAMAANKKAMQDGDFDKTLSYLSQPCLHPLLPLRWEDYLAKIDPIRLQQQKGLRKQANAQQAHLEKLLQEFKCPEFSFPSPEAVLHEPPMPATPAPSPEPVPSPAKHPVLEALIHERDKIRDQLDDSRTIGAKKRAKLSAQHKRFNKRIEAFRP